MAKRIDEKGETEGLTEERYCGSLGRSPTEEGVQQAKLVWVGAGANSEKKRKLAEAVRFELTDGLHRRQFSRLIH